MWLSEPNISLASRLHCQMCGWQGGSWVPLPLILLLSHRSLVGRITRWFTSLQWGHKAVAIRWNCFGKCFWATDTVQSGGGGGQFKRRNVSFKADFSTQHNISLHWQLDKSLSLFHGYLVLFATLLSCAFPLWLRYSTQSILPYHYLTWYLLGSDFYLFIFFKYVY